MKNAAMKTNADKFAFPMFPGAPVTNPKPEIRNPKEARSPKFETGAGRSGFGSSFDFRNSPGIRLSVFGFLLVPSRQPKTLRNHKLESPRWAFTLIELLTVIGIIGVIAGLILVVAGPVKKRQYIYTTQTEMAQLETAIERYKAAYGFYPPGRTNAPVLGNQPSYVNQLYYELTGTTNISSDPSRPVYKSLNDPSVPTMTGGPGGDVEHAFGVAGFVNCSKPGSGEDSAVARNFLPELKPNQVWKNYTNNIANNSVPVTLLIGSVGGPDAQYQPLGSQDLNPWRYNSSNPTNNPGAYELWIQLSLGRQTNLICNWTKQVQIGMTNLP